ncbi:MAG TPA: bifunctional molybdenum cofactor biosynthesis protein MoaC/MoaB, partial [Glaciibacter sp.]|nr:bifunctional molybdenum cofactor biosynthesis protein MoaC/MoaB [Glaciibacter sp.]
MNQLSHLDADGRARMVDVGSKPVTSRTATATGRLLTRSDVIALVRADDLPKADVLATARIAGISGAKRTSELIPLCHAIALSSVSVSFDLTEDWILISATARTSGQTGVEMEALTAVAIAGLTLHDMVKAVDPAATLSDVRLETKTGGSRGNWTRTGTTGTREEPTGIPVRAGSAAVIVSSTAAAAGTREDTTGPHIARWLTEHGYDVDAVSVVSDASIGEELQRVLATGPSVLLTTGGTGVSPSDRTPEATLAVIDRELPGIAEAIRARGL